MKHQDQKQFGEERISLTYASPSLFITEGKQGGNLEAGADTEAVFTGCSSGLAQSAYRTCDHQPWCGSTHNQQGPPTPENGLQAYVEPDLLEAFS